MRFCNDKNEILHLIEYNEKNEILYEKDEIL